VFSVEQPARLHRFGFTFGKGGAHAARTMMLSELRCLLDGVDAGAQRPDYRTAIVDSNVLDKATWKARQLTFDHLSDLYGLDPTVCLFRVFRQLWYLEDEGRPVLALLSALARDALLRLSAPLILAMKSHEQLTRERTEQLFADWSHGRLSPASLKAIAQRINGTWTQAGYLTGHVTKRRVAPAITPTAVTFALFLGFLEGRLAQRLFSSDWTRVLDLSEKQLFELTRSAATRGLVVLRRTGGVVEVRFPDYLTKQEQEWLRTACSCTRTTCP
jgi:hypothetical protein